MAREYGTTIYLRPWRVDVLARRGTQRVASARELARVVSSALHAASAPSPASVALILSNDDELARLNEQVAGRREPTDVLSFPLLPPSAFPRHAGSRRASGAHEPADFPLPPGHRPHLGDIVLSVERAIRQASEGTGGQTSDVRWAAADEMRLLAVHGALHLCGWDHAEPEEEVAMRELERRVLSDV